MVNTRIFHSQQNWNQHERRRKHLKNIIVLFRFADSGAVIPKISADGKKPEDITIQNLTRKDLTFADTNLDYDYHEIPKRIRDAPSLPDYVSARAGRPVEIAHRQLHRAGSTDDCAEPRFGPRSAAEFTR
jgi:hypothetical protein